MRNEMKTKLIKEFTNNVYGTLKNVFKYLLMFLSTSSYISSLKYNLKQIKDKKILTPDKEISGSDIEPIHEK